MDAISFLSNDKKTLIVIIEKMEPIKAHKKILKMFGNNMHVDENTLQSDIENELGGEFRLSLSLPNQCRNLEFPV